MQRYEVVVGLLYFKVVMMRMNILQFLQIYHPGVCIRRYAAGGFYFVPLNVL